MTLPSEYELLLFYDESRPRRSRLWRYGPVIAWIGVTFVLSTEHFSSEHTGGFLGPLLLALFPDMSAETFQQVHGYIRKAAHVTEYGVLAGLLARAFIDSWTPLLRRHWYLVSVAIIAVLALADEFHQSFVPNRTPLLSDSLIDISGALVVLTPIWIVHYLAERQMREATF